MFNTIAQNHAALDPTEAHRNAYNAAFYELGLKWHWDADTYRGLLAGAEEADRIRHYLANHQAHLLNAYDADFLVNAIQTTKERCLENITARGTCVDHDINWAAIHTHEVGV
jgi:hypothetical protein